MNPSRTPLIAGNWKMHKTVNETAAFFLAFAEIHSPKSGVEVAVAPPFTDLGAAVSPAGELGVAIYGQNMSEHRFGAFTGEVSGEMLLTSGCTGVILGHSERRHLFGENDDLIGRKVARAVDAELFPVVCVGETASERQADATHTVLSRQLGSALLGTDSKSLPAIAIAYEPVWAIGTGNVASPEIAQEAHQFIRAWLKENIGPAVAESTRILYGGSVKPANIAGLVSMPDIDGALIGGASLDPRGFAEMIEKTAQVAG